MVHRTPCISSGAVLSPIARAQQTRDYGVSLLGPALITSLVLLGR